jgi:uncharacterized protein (TIGR01777 family)
MPAGTAYFGWSVGEPVPEAALDGADAVIHLAGESIGAWPWTEERKRRILDSRVLGTRALVDSMERAARRGAGPKALISASATGYYGDCGDETLAEDRQPGKGFLADVCAAWEREIFRARDFGARAVAVRNGLVLGRGGALEKMLPAYRLGGGAVLGSGRQWWSWIHVQDTAGIFAHALASPDLQGPVNGCAPHPVTQREFARTLAKAVHRPLLLRAPSFALRLALGGMGDALLQSQKTDAARIAKGYSFRYGTLEGALKDILAGGGR